MEEQKQEEQDEGQEIKDLLDKTTGKPNQEQIDAWKAQHNGEVYVMAFSEKELYIWRPLIRSEYLNFQAMAQQGTVNQSQYEELVCDNCILWPSDSVWEKGKAGTPSTLFEQIMVQSNFLSPAAGTTLVAKL